VLAVRGKEGAGERHVQATTAASACCGACRRLGGPMWPASDFLLLLLVVSWNDFR